MTIEMVRGYNRYLWTSIIHLYVAKKAFMANL